VAPSAKRAAFISRTRTGWLTDGMKEGNKLAEEIKLAFMQASLKNGRNVEEVFVHIARLIKKDQERVSRMIVACS